MNKDIIKGEWKDIKGSVQKQWGKLTNDDLDQINGDRLKLTGKIQKAYGYAAEEAEKRVKEWEEVNSRSDRAA
jgi:uncharacterized protein YjbJ (UPF0337 family)